MMDNDNEVDNNNGNEKSIQNTIKNFNCIILMVQMVQFLHMQEVPLFFLSKVLNSEVFSNLLIPLRLNFINKHLHK